MMVCKHDKQKRKEKGARGNLPCLHRVRVSVMHNLIEHCANRATMAMCALFVGWVPRKRTPSLLFAWISEGSKLPLTGTFVLPLELVYLS